MKLKALIASGKAIVNKNASVIFAGIGIIGIGVTAYLTAKASFNAGVEEERTLQEARAKQDELNAARAEEDQTHHEFEHLKGKEFVQEYWKDYLPAVGAGAISIGAIVMSQIISFKQLAAMGALYAMTNKELETLKDKVKVECGKGKSEKVRQQVAEEMVKGNDGYDRPSFDASISGLTWFYDPLIDKYFQANIDRVRRGIIETTRDLTAMPISLNEFYNNIDIDNCAIGALVGWGMGDIFDIEFTSCLTPNGLPCIMMDYDKKPYPEYHRVW